VGAAPKRLATVESRYESGYRADVTAGRFSFVVDEPPSSGGTGAGPMPTEYLLVAVSACYAIALGHVAQRDGVTIGPFTVKVIGTYDGPRFSEIELRVVFDDRPPEGIGRLVEQASRVCYVSNTLRRGAAVNVVVAES
jgi:putative redox protein